MKGPSVIPSASGKVALKDITIFEDSQTQQVAMEIQALKEVSTRLVGPSFLLVG